MSHRVYYLDDEAHLCDLFREYLELSSIEVATFTDAKAAIRSCEEAPPTIFFIDYRLTDTTGDLVAQAVDPTIPKVLVTGDLGPQRTMEFQAVLGKPFRLKEIMALVKRLSRPQK